MPAPGETLLIEGALVYDPAAGGHEAIAADIAIERGRIAAVHRIADGTRHRADWAGRRIDARGKLATPGFVNAAMYDYHLTAGSPAVNAGIAAGMGGARHGLRLRPGQRGGPARRTQSPAR